MTAAVAKGGLPRLANDAAGKRGLLACAWAQRGAAPSPVFAVKLPPPLELLLQLFWHPAA